MGRVLRKGFRTGRVGFNAEINEFVRLFRSMVDPYRPELHYMRGPGPKWRAKHAVQSSEAPSLHGLARLRG
jgi:hypothetical protein